MMLADVAFYLFAGILTLSGILVVSVKNPVHSVLFLILAFFNAGGLFLLLGAEFLAMLMVIVYVGAVAVLFLFVVMMLDINLATIREGFVRYLPVGVIIALVLFIELVVVFSISLDVPYKVAPGFLPTPSDVTNTEALGAILYTHYVYIFQLAGIILLLAMMGSIVLTLRTRRQVRRQNITKQVTRKRQDAVELVKIQSGKGV